MFQIVYTSSFKKDYKKAKKQGKNLEILKKVMHKLTQGIPLDKKYKDHPLIGNYKNKRECHLLPNWLLIYEIDGANIVFYRTGSHSDLFKK